MKKTKLHKVDSLNYRQDKDNQGLMNKAELQQEDIIFIIYLFARAISLMKKLKIKETKAT